MAGLRGAPREPAWPEPRVFTDWRLRVLGVLVLLVPFFVPVPVELRRHLLIATLGDRLHMVLLAGVALALYWRGPLRGRLLAAAFAAMLVGGAIELLQEVVGRTALFHDFVLDAMGIAVVVGWVVWRGHGRRRGLVLIAAMLVITAVQLRHLPVVMVAAAQAKARFPVLEDCRHPVGHALWDASGGGEVTFVREGDPPCLRLRGGPPSRWPGASMRRFPHDWRGYEALEMRVRHRSASKDTLRFGVRIEDFQGIRDHDWYSAGFTATAAWQTITLPLADQVTHWTGRPLDLADVDQIALFLIEPAGDCILEATDLRLR